jgi:hypothetical protein
MVWVSLVVLFAPAPSGWSSASQINVGLTFSPREAAYRDLPWRHAFDAALDAAPSLVRVGAYWSEIESTPGEYDFTTLDWLLDRATARQQRVLLTVGMKAPRWPEYYLPAPEHFGPGRVEDKNDESSAEPQSCERKQQDD